MLCIYHTGPFWFLHRRGEAGGTGMVGKVSGFDGGDRPLYWGPEVKGAEGWQHNKWIGRGWYIGILLVASGRVLLCSFRAWNQFSWDVGNLSYEGNLETPVWLIEVLNPVPPPSPRQCHLFHCTLVSLEGESWYKSKSVRGVGKLLPTSFLCRNWNKAIERNFGYCEFLYNWGDLHVPLVMAIWSHKWVPLASSLPSSSCLFFKVGLIFSASRN